MLKQNEKLILKTYYKIKILVKIYCFAYKYISFKWTKGKKNNKPNIHLI